MLRKLKSLLSVYLIVSLIIVLFVSSLASAGPNNRLILRAYSPVSEWVADNSTVYPLYIYADSRPHAGANIEFIQFASILSAPGYTFERVEVTVRPPHDFYRGHNTIDMVGTYLIGRIAWDSGPADREGNFVIMWYKVSQNHLAPSSISTSLIFDTRPQVTRYKVYGNTTTYPPQLESLPFTLRRHGGPPFASYEPLSEVSELCLDPKEC